MKPPLKPRAPARPSAAEALRIVSDVAPSQPPVQVQAADRATTLNMRFRDATIDALTAEARRRGMTLKQIVAHALRKDGVEVAAADLEDRTPRRKR